MSENVLKRGELPPPELADASEDAVELLRIWAAPGKPPEMTLQTGWPDPAAWGMLMAEVVRRVTRLYEKDGSGEAQEIFEKIFAIFEAEFLDTEEIPEANKPAAH